jgi:hypothetical protein
MKIKAPNKMSYKEHQGHQEKTKSILLCACLPVGRLFVLFVV